MVKSHTRGALMVCGTTSNAGKTTLVTGFCRLLARRGVLVAPFKAQNMALNSMVTVDGGEIGRAQGIQAVAAGIEPEVAMNPILLKPTGERTCQVVVFGHPTGVMTALEYHDEKPQLLERVLGALADLRTRFDVVLCEGAGSPAEINLLDHDIVNLRIAHEAKIPAVIVGDIDLGGVFAALYGTVALLPEEFRALVRGFVVNRLRGDPDLLLDGCAQLRDRTGIPTLGVVPWIEGLALDAEDSLALRDHDKGVLPATADVLDVAVISLPRISNFTDLDPLTVEPGVRVRLVVDAASLGTPDLVIVPGTKSTVDDLAWLRAARLDVALRESTAAVLGICGGYQMLGLTIDDDVESATGRSDGLGRLPVRTVFAHDKVVERCAGTSLGHEVVGYRIHQGRVQPDGGDSFVEVAGLIDGVSNGSTYGTTVHGLFENDGFRRAFLGVVAEHAGKPFVPGSASFADARTARLDRIADAIEAHLDMDALASIIAEGAFTTQPASRSTRS
jgi:adenosylcobyric acid synthase